MYFKPGKKHMKWRSPLFLFFFLFSLLSCSTNPVTGESQWSMPISEQIAIGARQYAPAQQSQGGRYIVDADLNVYVNQVGQKVATHSDLDLPYEFVVLNNDVPNAWALPGGKIAINRGLLVLLEDEAQLAAVLGHEVVHAAAEHGATQMRKSQLLGLGVIVAGIASQESDYSAAITLGAAVGAQAWQAHYGRSQELQADHYGMKYMAAAGYETQAAVELQETFVKLSSQNGSGNALSALFASHPPSQERVDKNRAQVKKYPQGKRNKSAYQNAIAQIKKDQPAYKANLEAQSLAAEKKWEEALQSVKRAQSLQPNEAMFFLTEGRIHLAKEDVNAALKPLEKAGKLNPDYFLPSLLHGLTARELKQNASAKASLQRSYDSLPTAIAAYNLGEIELQEGDKVRARAWFKEAAADEGEIGKKARQQLDALGS